MTIACFGELMLRLTPTLPGQTLHDTDNLKMEFAGAEGNVAIGLSKLGNQVKFLSKLPNNAIGERAASSLHRLGVDCSLVVKGGERIGAYFIELGHSIRPSRVIYDRHHSAISQARPDEFNWQHLLQDVECLHLSGITPALSDNCIEITLNAAKVAQQMGVIVSFDMNFRRRLWENKARAKEVFVELLNYANIVFGNPGVMGDVFDQHYDGLSPEKSNIQAARDLSDNYGVLAATTCRIHHSADENTLSAVIADQQHIYQSHSIKVNILDRLGTGDAFAAACLHGLIHHWPQQKIINFATAAFALSHTTYGDPHLSSQEQIEAIAAGHTCGYIDR
ncbi:sugar kinase [Gilvimarinus polysaccharolyticus]|uniref:sugar kinase n=1 Tax=Gilvimarinus polysaccharolyticus TaxID=863921 RepID=UPI0006731244|nr:sugar kinase [Gilvimarinus polysaccharolyticus]